MSITADKNKSKGVTVITVAPDSESMFPPLNCPRGGCDVVSSLGTLQIMVGLFNIGLGPGRTSFHPEDFANLGAAYWLGGVFILNGIISLLANSYPSRDLRCFALFMNIIASIIAAVGIALYAVDLDSPSLSWLCDSSSSSDWYYGSSDDCKHVAHYLERLITGMDITMIVMTGLQLLASVTFTVRFCGRMKDEQGDEDAEIQKPLLKEVFMTSPGA
ncbi:High affinity immunoglobulin epsilon receptor subunit beta [Collichthys lucidus]|nr:High affinity immunoglobulin epsilon receptor subunit beta [Collichthys lucidus]